MNILEFLDKNPWFSIFLTIWTIFWKGMALWKSAKSGQKYWFMGLLVLNTLGIMDIIYLFFFNPEPLKIKQIIGKASSLFKKGKGNKK